MALATNRTTSNTVDEHVADHNEAHGKINTLYDNPLARTRLDLSTRTSLGLADTAVQAGQVLTSIADGSIAKVKLTSAVQTSLNAADAAAPATGPFSPTNVNASVATRYMGGTSVGSPGGGSFSSGDWVVGTNGRVYLCTGAGTPGTWVTHGPVTSTTPTAVGTAAIGTATDVARADHVHPQQQYVQPTGSMQVSATTRYIGGTASGAPTAGTWQLGDHVIAQNGRVWICTTAGSPGTWVDAGGIPSITNHTYGLTSAAAATKAFGIKMAASQTADPFDVVDSTDVQKAVISAVGTLKAVGGLSAGTGAVSASAGNYAQVGDYGDANNIYVQALGPGADINLLLQAKGAGVVRLQNAAGTDLMLLSTPAAGASTDTPLILRINGINKLVTAGPADSGGTGYRYLRVPN